MEDIATKTGVGGGIFGLVGVVVGWFGLKYRIAAIKENVEQLSNNVRYKETCEEIIRATDLRLASIEAINKEMREDIKELLKKRG